MAKRSVDLYEQTRPERHQGCLDGLALCERMTSIQDVMTEIEARKPELELLRKEGDMDKYWRFRCADAQLEWFLQVMAAGEGSLKSARALLHYRTIVNAIEGQP